MAVGRAGSTLHHAVLTTSMTSSWGFTKSDVAQVRRISRHVLQSQGIFHVTSVWLHRPTATTALMMNVVDLARSRSWEAGVLEDTFLSSSISLRLAPQTLPCSCCSLCARSGYVCRSCPRCKTGRHIIGSSYPQQPRYW